MYITIYQREKNTTLYGLFQLTLIKNKKKHKSLYIIQKVKRMNSNWYRNIERGNKLKQFEYRSIGKKES